MLIESKSTAKGNTMKTGMRKIVRIDESKCNGCGQCVPSCAEGAIRIIDGKARLVADNLCDGLGNCLGECPMEAITIEERPAEQFDEAAVAHHLGRQHSPAPARSAAASARWAPVPAAAAVSTGCPSKASAGGGSSGAPRAGCPGSAFRKVRQAGVAPAAEKPKASLRLGQWPVQLSLVPTQGEMWHNADVLIAADCVAFTMGDFHDALLAGKTLAIACPKLDDTDPHVAKLAAIFASNPIRSITVAHMEVPCCMGIIYIVQMALEKAKVDIPVREITVGIDGAIQRIE